MIDLFEGPRKIIRKTAGNIIKKQKSRKQVLLLEQDPAISIFQIVSAFNITPFLPKNCTSFKVDCSNDHLHGFVAILTYPRPRS